MVYCIGETVLDVIFRNDQVIAAKPGGSMLNTAVSLGRAGIPVEFISEIASDQPGELIVTFLHENNVGTHYLSRYADGKTTIALAFLDNKSDAKYSFYSDLPDERLKDQLPLSDKDDIILFGSFFSLEDEIHKKLIGFLSIALENKAVILYDPNFRSPHLADLPEVFPHIRENFNLADVIRGSHEDFLHIFALAEAEDVHLRLRLQDRQGLVYTRSGDSVCIFTSRINLSVPVPEIEPVSTIGAGDSFNAGLIFALTKMHIDKVRMVNLSSEEWTKIASLAIRFSQNVCMSLENYISKDLLLTLEI